MAHRSSEVTRIIRDAAVKLREPEVPRPENPILFLTGPPGSGKAIMAGKIAGYFECELISIGKLIRRELHKRTALGKKLSERMKRGLAAPIGMIMEIIKVEIAAIQESRGSVPILLQGFPRGFIQLKVFETEIRPADFLVALHVDVEVAQERIRPRSKMYHRKEDTPILIKLRCEHYAIESQPVGEVLAAQGRACLVEANGSVLDTWRSVKKALEGRLKRRSGVRDEDDYDDYDG